MRRNGWAEPSIVIDMLPTGTDRVRSLFCTGNLLIHRGMDGNWVDHTLLITRVKPFFDRIMGEPCLLMSWAAWDGQCYRYHSDQPYSLKSLIETTNVYEYRLIQPAEEAL